MGSGDEPGFPLKSVEWPNPRIRGRSVRLVPSMGMTRGSSLLFGESELM